MGKIPFVTFTPTLVFSVLTKTKYKLVSKLVLVMNTELIYCSSHLTIFFFKSNFIDISIIICVRQNIYTGALLVRKSKETRLIPILNIFKFSCTLITKQCMQMTFKFLFLNFHAFKYFYYFIIFCCCLNA